MAQHVKTAYTAGDTEDSGLLFGSIRYPGGGNGTPVFLSEKSHGQRSLSGYSPKGRKESDMTAQLSTQGKMAITLFSDLVSMIESISNIGISKSWSKWVNMMLTDLEGALSHQ